MVKPICAKNNSSSGKVLTTVAALLLFSLGCPFIEMGCKAISFESFNVLLLSPNNFDGELLIRGGISQGFFEPRSDMVPMYN